MTTELVQRMKAAALNAKHAGEAPIMPFDTRISALNEFQLEACPVNVLALVEALEAAEKRGTDMEVACELFAESKLAQIKLEAALEKAQQRIAELEARTVKLPDYSETYTTGFASEIEHQVRKVLEMAGVAVEGE